MSRFLAGFLAASLFWPAGLFAARALGLVSVAWRAGAEATEEASTASGRDAHARDPADPKRKRHPVPVRPRNAQARATAAPTGEATSGDDLDLGGARNLDLGREGGEEQLLDREIEQAFDQNFAQVRRCLVLASSDVPVRGTLTFGLRISGRHGVTKVNLQGPAAVTTGEAGDCLRKAARAIHLRTFDGPDMVVHYPLVLN